MRQTNGNRLIASSELIRTINRSMILDIIRVKGPLSRAQISKEVGVSLSTSMRIVDDLIEDSLVISVGAGKSTGGRPGELVDFNHSGFAVIGIDMGGTKIYGSISDLGGNTYSEIRIPSFGENHATDSTDQLIQLIETLLKTPRPVEQKMMGIGIGAPGFESAEGLIATAPSLGWKDYPLRKILTERFKLPVFIENDVNLAALGEYGFGAGQGTKDMICIGLGTGIGAGLIIGGVLYKGHSLTAGEVGYMIPGVEFLGQNYSGFGALEQVASGTGIALRARQLLQAQHTPFSSEEVTAKYVLSAARLGEAWAIQIVDDVVKYLSIALANISALLNPEVIVLTGGLMESADLLLDPIRKCMEGLVPSIPRLAISTLGPRATVMGAILFVLTAVTDSHAVRQLP